MIKKKIMNTLLEKVILEVAEVAGYLWQKGWAERNAGNISVNISDIVCDDEFGNLSDLPVFELKKEYKELAGKYFFVTGTGKRMRDLAISPMENSLMIRVLDKGKSYCLITNNLSEAVHLTPTSELPTHLGIHQMIAQRGTNEKVIIHTHATELVALTHNPKLKETDAINRLLWAMHPETMVFVPKGVGFVPYILPGSVKIAEATIKALANHNMALWEKHGVFSIGETVAETFDNIDIISKSAKIYFMCREAGFNPEGLSLKQLEEIKKYY